jgi:hypothetical protein
MDCRIGGNARRQDHSVGSQLQASTVALIRIRWVGPSILFPARTWPNATCLGYHVQKVDRILIGNTITQFCPCKPPGYRSVECYASAP